MNLRDILLLVTVTMTWGLNFIAIKYALQQWPPLLLCAIRFTLVALPAIFFLPRPGASWRQVFLYGLTGFAGVFALLFGGMAAGLSAGLASLLLQVQIFMTIALAVVFLGERPSPAQLIGAGLAFVGVMVIAGHISTGSGDISLLGLAGVLGAACAWALANLQAKRMPATSMLSVVAWSCLFAAGPLFVLSLLLEGIPEPGAWRFDLPMLGALAFMVYPTTLFAYAVWGYLLRRYPASTVAPFSLLVPVFGMAGASVLLHEALPLWKWGAGLLILSGLAVNLFGMRLWGWVKAWRTRASSGAPTRTIGMG